MPINNSKYFQDFIVMLILNTNKLQNKIDYVENLFCVNIFTIIFHCVRLFFHVFFLLQSYTMHSYLKICYNNIHIYTNKYYFAFYLFLDHLFDFQGNFFEVFCFRAFLHYFFTMDRKNKSYLIILHYYIVLFFTNQKIPQLYYF